MEALDSSSKAAGWSQWQGDALDQVKCRFGCDDPVVGIYHVPQGCACWPDPVQALCWQHYDKAQSEGPIRALVWRPIMWTDRSTDA